MEPLVSSQWSKKSVIILPINKVQSYAWGSKDKKCFVGQMTQQNLQTYAEFWMGTHPNGESKISEQLSLKQYLSSQNIVQIEFLFKILSIQKCLSIQAHPNEEEARQLNKYFPQIYVDDKDKPEMFLTLSDKFELLLGFLQEKQFQRLIEIEPFKTLSSQIGQCQYKEKILLLVQKLVDLNETELNENICNLFNNLVLFEKPRQHLVIRLFDEFAYDAGVLVSCLLEYHILQKGSCFGIEAGVPHAYIKGECFQLMKNSDNVVRLGLTPKPKDIPNLMKILKNNIHRTYSKVEKWQTSFTEKFQWNSYSILRLKLTSQQNKIQIDSSSIGIILNGQAFISSVQTGENLILIPQKTVFFIHKGSYLFEGQGQIVIASKY